MGRAATWHEHAPARMDARRAGGAARPQIGVRRARRCRPRRRERPAAEPPTIAVEPERYDGAFEALIAPLPEASRDALRLRFVDDLDYEGIATRLGCSPEAARQRVSTAVRNLRERHAA